MKFQAFHVNPGEKLKKKDVNNDLSNFMSVFPIARTLFIQNELPLTVVLNIYYMLYYECMP